MIALALAFGTWAASCGGAGKAVPVPVEIDWPDAAPIPSPPPSAIDTADAGPEANRD